MATKQSIDVGVARPVYMGAWSETADYEYLNIVSNRGCVWMCVTDSYAEGDEPVHWYEDETYPDETPPDDPMVTRSGSWVCIAEKGEKGDKGDQGIQGVAGRDGADGEQGPQGLAPEHEWNGSMLRFKNPDGTWSEWSELIGPQGNEGPQGSEGPQGPQGPAGAKGEEGKAATIEIGSVEMVGPNDTVRVENTGTSNNAILNFKIPRGAKGDKGDMPTDYVSINGSALNGTYIFPAGDRILTNTDSSFLRSNGSTGYHNGSSLLLTGKNFSGYNGRWELEAYNGSQGSMLQGFASGELKWTGNKITCSNFNGLASKATQLNTARSFRLTGAASSNAASFNGTGDVALKVTSLDASKLTGSIPQSLGVSGGYSKYEDGYTYLPGGILLQWGFETRASNGYVTPIFPKPFPSKLFALTVTPVCSIFRWDEQGITINHTALNHFQCYIGALRNGNKPTGLYTNFGVFWMALGC